MIEQPSAEFDIYPARRVGEHIASQILQQHMENPEDCQPGDDHDQGGVTSVDEHLSTVIWKNSGVISPHN